MALTNPIVTASATSHLLIMQWIPLLVTFNTKMYMVKALLHKVYVNHQVFVILGTVLDIQRSASDFAKRKVAIYEDFDPFEAYSQLCATNVRARSLSDIEQIKQTTDSDAFQKYMKLCARNVIPRLEFPSYLFPNSNQDGPSVSNQRKRTCQTSQIRRALDETNTSKRVRRLAASARSIHDMAKFLNWPMIRTTLVQLGFRNALSSGADSETDIFSCDNPRAEMGAEAGTFGCCNRWVWSAEMRVEMGGSGVLK
ncbi:hypothetical protein Tco_0785101 [Tanacetum coccineum]